MWQGKTINAKGWVASLVIIVVAATLALVGITQRQPIIDNIVAAQYQPSSQVADIREDLDLTPYGELLFNASQPELQVADEFNDSCQQHQETNNPVIGCYASQRIFIYDIKNEKLNGIEETTAAHELLHAVYERMSDNERKEIDAEIRKVLRTVITPELEERLEHYKKTEPGQKYNELHAILGTEFPKLSDALERHYSKYFESRDKIVDYFNKYNSVFEQVTAKLEAQLKLINSLTQQTNARIASYNDRQKALNNDIAAFNQRAQSGYYSSAAEYQADRSALEARRAALQQERVAIESSITRINNLTAQRNKLVDEYNALSQSINSSIDPIKTLEN